MACGLGTCSGKVPSVLPSLSPSRLPYYTRVGVAEAGLALPKGFRAPAGGTRVPVLT